MALEAVAEAAGAAIATSAESPITGRLSVQVAEAVAVDEAAMLEGVVTDGLGVTD